MAIELINETKFPNWIVRLFIRIAGKITKVNDVKVFLTDSLYHQGDKITYGRYYRYANFIYIYIRPETLYVEAAGCFWLENLLNTFIHEFFHSRYRQIMKGKFHSNKCSMMAKEMSLNHLGFRIGFNEEKIVRKISNKFEITTCRTLTWWLLSPILRYAIKKAIKSV